MASLVAGNYAVDMNDDIPPEPVLFGRSERMAEVKRRMEKLAGASIPILLQGESGTGKEIFARLFHKFSPLSSGPYVKVNCPAIPGTLMESELFGYEKGAFTGATGTKVGRVELAHRGTLFLDEISEMNLDFQSKLLQLLQDGHFCRIGAEEDRRVEVRVICATNRDLKAEVIAQRFRQDLYYRIAVMTIHLPSLRERAEDIPIIVEWLIHRYSEKYNTPAPVLSHSLMSALQGYSWPGNIRELENVIRRFVILGTESAVRSELQGQHRLYVDDFLADGDLSLKKATRRVVEEIERRLILTALQNNNWNRKKAARNLSISYRALLYKIQRAGIVPFRHVSAALPALPKTDGIE